VCWDDRCAPPHLVDFKLFFGGTGIWTYGFTLAQQHSTAWATPPVHFALVILETDSLELFARAGLEPRSSQSQPPK
jgi:hypothetical protein